MEKNKGVANRLSPLNNLVFASLFQDMESAPAMLELLNAILEAVNEEPVEEILSIQSEYPLIAKGAGAKYGRVDVLVRAKSKRVFDFEVQIEWDAMNSRGFFYGGRLMTDEFKEGQPYEEMPKLRVINLLDFVMRKDNKEMVQPVIFAYGNEPVREATDIFKIYNIQMPIFRKKYKTLESVKGNVFYTWLYLLDRGYKSEEEMEAMAMMSEGMMTFAKRYNIAINDPDLKALYRMEQDALHEEASRLRNAEKRGEKRGEERGERNEKLRNAKNMKMKGYPLADIADITGLTLKDINAL